jgi:uncharacterized protein YecT (DUF1311 family)
MKIIIITIFNVLTINCFSQTIKDLNRIDANSQTCADTAIDVIACELIRYKKTDSLLNTVYNKLKTNLKNDEFKNLKNDQLKWLKYRDLKFKELKMANNCDVYPDICQALLISKRTWIVRERVLFLIKRLN